MRAVTGVGVGVPLVRQKDAKNLKLCRRCKKSKNDDGCW